MNLPAAVAREMPFLRREVTVDDARISVVDDGPRDARETLLFLHGNPTWSFLWRKLLAAGKADGHRVVAPDHEGCGMSSKPEDPSTYSLARHVRNLEAVARELDLRDVTLVLHDWGGPIGMGFAARNPERVKRIVIANTVAFAPTRARPMSRWHAAFASPIGYKLGVALNLVQRSALRFGVRTPLARDVLEAYAWPMRDRGARVAAGRFVQLVPDGPDHPTAATLREYEANFPKLEEKPMLVLWADRDPVFPAKLAERWTKPFPHAVVRHVSATAGHFWQEDDPQAFVAPLLAFVREP